VNRGSGRPVPLLRRVRLEELFRRGLRKLVNTFPRLTLLSLNRNMLSLRGRESGGESAGSGSTGTGSASILCPWCGRLAEVLEDQPQAGGKESPFWEGYARVRCGNCGSAHVLNPLSPMTLHKMWMDQGICTPASPLQPVDSPWPLPALEEEAAGGSENPGAAFACSGIGGGWQLKSLSEPLCQALEIMAGISTPASPAPLDMRDLTLARARLLALGASLDPKGAAKSAPGGNFQVQSGRAGLSSVLLAGNPLGWTQAAARWNMDFQHLDKAVRSLRPVEEFQVSMVDRAIEWHPRLPDLLQNMTAPLLPGGILCTLFLDHPEDSREPMPAWNRPWASPNLPDWKSYSRLMDSLSEDFVCLGVLTESWEGAPLPGFKLCFHRKGRKVEYRAGQRVLLVCGGAFGDTLLTVPLARALSEQGCRVSLLGVNAAILKPSPWFERVFCGIDELSNDLESGSEGSSRAYDRVLHLAYEYHPGYSLVQGYGLCAGLEVDNPVPEYTFPEEYERGSALRDLDLDSSAPLVVIHTQTGDRLKSWSPNSFAQVARALEEKGCQVVTIGGPQDCSPLAGIRNAIGLTSIAGTADLIASASLLVGVDSLPMHLAAALGTPRVILFGSTEPALVDTNPSGTRAIFADLPCLGCRMSCQPGHWRQNAVCRIASAESIENFTQGLVVEPPPCMQAIAPEIVVAACADLLGQGL